MKIAVKRSEKQNEAVVFCETLGILHPRMSWLINQQLVYNESVTQCEWSFAPSNSSTEVALNSLDKWYSVATGKLTFNDKSSANVSLECAHEMDNDTVMHSEPYTCKLYYMCYQVK